MHQHNANTPRTIPAGPPPETQARLARLAHARALVIAQFGATVLIDVEREDRGSTVVVLSSR